MSIIIICSIKDKIINAIKTLTNQNLENFEIILIYDDNNIKEYNLIFFKLNSLFVLIV